MSHLDRLKSPHQLRVEEFMRRAKQNLPEFPTEPTPEVRVLRAKLMLEEVLETIWEGLGVRLTLRDDYEENGTSIAGTDGLEVSCEVVTNFNLEKTIDGCIDTSVVTIGTLSACGVPDKPFLELVDENNLAKFGPGHTIREDGKLIKPHGHKPPDIEGRLKELTEDRVVTGCIYDTIGPGASRQVFFYSDKKIGDFIPFEDGDFRFWPVDGQGAWSGYVLANIASRLKNLNADRVVFYESNRVGPEPGPVLEGQFDCFSRVDGSKEG